MRIKGVLFFALIMMALVWPGLTRGADGRDVVFSEIAWAGSSRSSSDEWIELYNSTDVIVDLAGWEIWDVASTPKLLVQFPKGRIASHGRFLVANNEADYLFSAGESALSVQPDIIDSQLTLSNSALKLELRRSDETVADLAGIEDDIMNLATVSVVEENLLDQDDVISLVNLPQDALQLDVTEQVTGQAADVSIVARSLLALASGVEKQRAQLSALQVQAATQKSSTLPVTWSLVSVMIATSFVVCLGADWLWEFLTSELLH